jgi:hypothetical protein
MKYEYATTWGLPELHYGDRISPPDAPEEPDGDGWELVNGCASSSALYWFWRREVILELPIDGNLRDRIRNRT